MAEVLPGLASKVAPTLPLYNSVWADIAGPKEIRPFRETEIKLLVISLIDSSIFF